jgi:uncharacterized repeat protein (TIGR01451 family)
VPLTAEVSPEANSDDYNMKLKKGKDATITVTADTTLADDGWYFGTLDLDRNLDKGPDLHMPVAVKAAKATNPDLFTKTVDASTASPGDTLTYELTVTNSQKITGPISVHDMVPDGTTFVPASETEVVIGGLTSSPWAYDGGTNSLSWTGELDVGTLDVIASPSPFGYVPLGAFFAPFGLPSNCDDGALIVNVPSFTYNGASYAQVIWSVNGTLEAGTASGQATSFANQNLPDPTPPNNLLAPFWRDLDLCAGGNWYVGTLTDGVGTWLIFEWEDVPHFGSPDAATFQIWLELDGSPTAPAINYTYARMDNTGVGATVGAENTTGTDGASYFFNGAGTPPAVGVDLGVVVLPGGSATLGFQIVTDCSADPTVNEGELTNGANSERAIAVTTCP